MPKMPNDKLAEAMLGIKPGLEPILADRSLVQQYAECPYAAWAKIEYKIETTSLLRDVGTETHKLAEECIKTGIDDQVLPEDMADWFVNELPKVRPDIQPNVIRAVKHLADAILQLRPHKIIGVEEQIDFPSDLKSKDNRRFVLTTCLDLLTAGNESLIVQDWKSGFKKRSNQETYDDFQAQFGAFVLWQMYPDLDTIHWFFDETFWGTKSYARFERNASTIHPDLTTEMQFKGRIFSALRLWQEDSREAWPEEKKCCWCDAIYHCPHAQEEAKDCAKDPKAFIDHMTVLTELLKRYKATAVDYMKSHGPIKGTNMVFEWRQPNQKFTPKLYRSELPPAEKVE